MPLTVTGVMLLAVLPSPSWPYVLEPQHWIETCVMLPVEINAQVCDPPSEMAVALVMLLTITGKLLLVAPTSSGRLLPSWPRLLFPQHWMLPVESNAQECEPPSEMAVAVVMPPIFTGVLVLFVKPLVPLPSWPSLFFPQHWMLPVESNAHV